MKEILLSKTGKHKGKYVALVDDEDYEYLSQWNWTADVNNTTYYAYRRNPIRQERKLIWMHRVLMNTLDGMEVDHIDHNGLNNQKSNLRNCTRLENCRNVAPYGKSKYLGVHLHKNKYKDKITLSFRSVIHPNKKQISLGLFKTEEAAARAYDEAAKKYFGDFANLNFKF